MFQNLKVDIIYYKTNTDFEMEFNLCGCCRMRLLTDKTPDKKTMVMSLSRAVSRSRVIIVVGSLFGDNSIIKLTAGAIGSSVSPADNETYGIAGDQEIEIINGSIPLVTTEGYFGGCIIESGPQTLILLTENKNIRKSVMKNLIHPYIEELCSIELHDRSENTQKQELPQMDSKQNDDSEEITDISESEDEKIENTDEILEETADIESDGNEDMILVTDTDEEPSEPEELDDILLAEESIQEEELDIDYSDDTDESLVDSELLFDTETINMKDFIIRNEEYYNEQEPVEDLITDDNENEFVFQKSSHLNTPIFIVSILLLVLIIVLCYCIFYVPSKDGVSASVYVKEIFDTLFG